MPVYSVTKKFLAGWITRAEFVIGTGIFITTTFRPSLGLTQPLI
jgi:hypothetical protein